MTIKQFIDFAKMGGCDIEDFHPLYITTAEPRHIPIEGFLMNPEAWKAVGKVEGWTENEEYFFNEDRWSQGWKNNMHRMIDALAEGKSIEEFLATL